MNCVVLGRVTGLLGHILLRSGIGVMLSALFMVASAQSSEAGLRVAFVYNFLKFIEWPQHSGEDIALCALGSQSTTRQALAQLDNKLQQQRRIRVVYLDEPQEVQTQLSSCQMIYVPDTGAHLVIPESLPAGVLLVVDEPNPTDLRVGIALLRTADNRIEFIINEAAVQQAGVKVSSQLLKLAKKRKRGGNQDA